MNTSGWAPRLRSIDGRTFTGDVPQDLPLLAGDFVLLDTPAVGIVLGQVLEKGASGRTMRVSGALRAVVTPEGAVSSVAPRPFADASMRVPSVDIVTAFHRWSGADMPIGWTISGGEEQAPALLRRTGFNRHTFVCGQSGSGKTYALGVLIEQLLGETDLPLVVIDPNSDYARLGQLRPDADPARATRLRTADIHVLSTASSLAHQDAERLAVSFAQMTSAAKAAALRVDPIHDREEYNNLLHILDDSAGQGDVVEFVRQLDAEHGEIGRAAVQRIQNLGILRWSIWARGRASLLDVVKRGSRALVLDLSGCRVPQERSVAAIALLDHLWEQRDERRPFLLVLDEAHNLCTSSPVDALQAAVTERLVQIAAEGRKYGLWLMLSTQQPHKIHPNVLSQCDNLVLMRLNSVADLARLGEVFGAAPPQMLATVTTFRQGELLLAGAFVAAPMIARVADRLTMEGGGDVPVPLRCD